VALYLSLLILGGQSDQVGIPPRFGLELDFIELTNKYFSLDTSRSLGLEKLPSFWKILRSSDAHEIAIQAIEIFIIHEI